MSKEKTIIFSGPMVRALLAGTKTQTRRIIKPQPEHSQYHVHNRKVVYEGEHRMWCWGKCVVENIGDFGPQYADNKELASHCPYGVPSDRLWVRESFQPLLADELGAEPDRDQYDYKTGKGYAPNYPATDGVEEFYDMAGNGAFCSRITPSIFMPRWASRITLRVTEVRVQRLQDISADDCIAEGVSETSFWTPKEMEGKPFEDKWWDDFHFWNNYPQIAYRRLWESINGPGSWAANPWVWAVSFERVP